MYKKNLTTAERRKVEILEKSIVRKHLTDKHLALALSYRKPYAGLKIFPAWNETTPVFKDYEYRASYFERDIRRMWSKYQGATPCFALLSNRNIVIECSGKLGGPQLLANLLSKLGSPTGDTPHFKPLVVATPDGNAQIYYYVPDQLLASSKGLIAPGIDVRCIGDFVPVPGSYRLDGRQWKAIGDDGGYSCDIPRKLYDFIAEKNHHEQMKLFAELTKLKG